MEIDENFFSTIRKTLVRGPILVGGPSGGGKSWLSSEIARIMKCPNVDLDAYSKHTDSGHYPAENYPVLLRAVYNGWPSNLKEVDENVGFVLIITPKPYYYQFIKIHEAKASALRDEEGLTRSIEWHDKITTRSQEEVDKLFDDYARLVKTLLPHVQHITVHNGFSGSVNRGWHEH